MTKRKARALTDDERMFVTVAKKLTEVCPPRMRMVAIFYHPEAGPLVIGSCCDGCASALVHMAADMVPDPRIEEEQATVH